MRDVRAATTFRNSPESGRPGATPAGADFLCAQPTEPDILEQDFYENLQRYNFITKSSAGQSGFRQHARGPDHELRPTSRNDDGYVIQVTQSLAARCRIVAA
jgi:hypothetical protein